MRVPTTKIVTGLFLLLFMLSTLQFPNMQSGSTGDLRVLVSKLQQLQETSQKPKIDFQIIFSNAIHSLHKAAGLKTLAAQQTTTPPTQQTKIIVSIKLPCLLPQQHNLTVADISTELDLPEGKVLYQSYISPPPPPFPIIA